MKRTPRPPGSDLEFHSRIGISCRARQSAVALNVHGFILIFQLMVIQGHALETSLVGPMDPRVTFMLEQDGNVARWLEITQLTQPKVPRQSKACLAGRLNVYLGSVYWEQHARSPYLHW